MTQDLTRLDALLRRRHSCRAFGPDQLPRDVIERIVETAGRAPSWCNSQPWHLTITIGAETERLRTALMQQAKAGAPRPDVPFPIRYRGVYLDRRRDCGWSLYKAVGVERGDRAGSARQMAENFALFGAPHCAILSSPADLGPYGVLDCGGFITAFTLAAEALGVASIPQAAVAGFAPFLHGHFDIPDDRQILCGIAFGLSDTAHPANSFRTGRAPIDQIVDWRN